MPLRNSTAFFAHLRTGLLGPVLSNAEVDGCNHLIGAFERALWPVSFAAYALATAWHETAGTMQPIKERGSRAYLDKYDTGKLAAALGNTPADDDDGILYAGRGYVQLTGARNYRVAGKKLGIDLIAKPDRALDPHVAADIMVAGMQEGWFTGKRMDTYLPRANPASVEQFIQARRIINGSDAAQKIAGHALEFQTALTKGQWI